ncbi:hypothetical protein LJ656_22535 [Paraburkholderia sp. MMS20-SJTR3]|uniref:CMD domain protein n=1 Tax=Paraburkholderia sejongensis TaxID=2886946 RepID=A0ABS8K047_9BURK|nr:hypothetical protein [Paraburkholderia sp. MMS20-SJTR3]MCC8395370.1 hypothetical protein [Paraburkholderia sp. MMS20-SJTR3]
MTTEVKPTPAPEDDTARLAGIAPAGAVAALRAARADATRYTQGSFDALFDARATGLSLAERLAAASYAAGLSAAPEAARAYRERLLASGSSADGAIAALDRFVADGVTHANAADTRLGAILTHTHALATLSPSADRSALLRLKQAGLSTPDIVALSQLVAFVTYQVRLAAALRALEATA